MPDEPLRTTTFTLTTADALAYEQAGARMTPLGALTLVFWLGLWGALALLVPADWAGSRLSWSFNLLALVLVSIGAVLALLLIATRQWLAARRRIRRPTELTLAEWPDRLEIGGPGLPRRVEFTAIRRTILGRTTLFLDTDDDVLMVPRRAFPEEGTIEALAARIEGTLPAPPVDPAPPSA